MQLKTLILAATIGLAQAADWSDNSGGSVDKPEKPASTPSVPLQPPNKPVGGDKPDGPPKGGDKPDGPPKGGEKPDGPPKGGDKPDGPPKGGDKPTPDTPAPTTTIAVTTTYWGDQPVIETSTTLATTSTTHYWGDDPLDETSTTSSSTSSYFYWGDNAPEETPVSGGHGHGHGKPEKPVDGGDDEPEKPVDGGYGKPNKPWQPEQPVSGGHGKPEQPVSGGNGQPPAPPAGGKCGVVTETVVNTVTITVTPGAKPPPPKTPVEEKTTAPPAKPTAVHTWGDATTLATQWKDTPAAPKQDGYMGIVQEYRAKMGLSALTHDSKLESNALDTAASSGGSLKHKLNPGSMAQVLAPGSPSDFEKVFVGGWLCEMPGIAGLDGICGQMSNGWNHAGQTGHAKILTDRKYSKIGCGCKSNIWSCDLS